MYTRSERERLKLAFNWKFFKSFIGSHHHSGVVCSFVFLRVFICTRRFESIILPYVSKPLAQTVWSDSIFLLGVENSLSSLLPSSPIPLHFTVLRSLLFNPVCSVAVSLFIELMGVHGCEILRRISTGSFSSAVDSHARVNFF